MVTLPISGHRTLVRDMSGAHAGVHQPLSPELDCNIALLVKTIWLAALFVIGLGYFREIFLLLEGDRTVLKDLHHFAFDAEHSLPAWFESLLMAAASLLCAICAALSRRYDPRNRRHWIALAAVFFCFSADEAAAFHEVAITPLREALHLTDYFYFSWVLLGAPLLLMAGIACLAFLARLPRDTALGFTIAGAVFVGGAFGLELVGGHFASTAGWDSLSYRLCSSIEETLEITGMALFVSTLLTLISRRAPLLTIRFR